MLLLQLQLQNLTSYNHGPFSMESIKEIETYIYLHQVYRFTEFDKIEMLCDKGGTIFNFTVSQH